MNFSELETLMSSRGVTTLAEIARTLNTTPQAVSNWKARDQVPYHIVNKVNNVLNKSKLNYEEMGKHDLSVVQNVLEGEYATLSDLLLIMAQQLKVIIIFTIVAVFMTFTYNFSTNKIVYKSSSKILLPAAQSASAGGLAGLASQFGVNMSQSAAALDLSSTSLFPDLIKSRTFTKRILDKKFYMHDANKELSLLAIYNNRINEPISGRDSLFISAMDKFQERITFNNEGAFSVLKVESSDPVLARDINIQILDELQKLHQYYKSQHVSDKIAFINNRIAAVSKDLENSERDLLIFREQNRQVSSPALQLEQEHLSRDLDIQKGIFLTLKQQLELANIEKIQSETVIQILDKPEIPMRGTGNNILLNSILAGIVGLFLGIILAFVRSYLNNNDNMDERRKIRRIRNFIKKKTKDVIIDPRFSGIISFVLICGSPYYFGHKSQNPVYFDRYSSTLMFINIVYLLVLIASISIFFHLNRKNKSTIS